MACCDHCSQTFYKTASLIANSARCAAILGGHGEDVSASCYDYGKHTGLAFQVLTVHPFLPPPPRAIRYYRRSSWMTCLTLLAPPNRSARCAVGTTIGTPALSYSRRSLT